MKKNYKIKLWKVNQKETDQLAMTMRKKTKMSKSSFPQAVANSTTQANGWRPSRLSARNGTEKLYICLTEK